MKTLVTGAALLGLLTAPVGADTTYDRELEQAAIAIVASRMGDIRGGFAFDVPPLSVIIRDQRPTGSAPQRNAGMPQSGAWRDGLAPAIERKAGRFVF